MIQRERLWRFHRYRTNDEYCPLCFEPITWIYDREKGEFAPCNRTPVLYITDKMGTAVDMYTSFRRPIRGILYNSWDERFKNRQRVKQGFLPHVYSCAELTKD